MNARRPSGPSSARGHHVRGRAGRPGSAARGRLASCERACRERVFRGWASRVSVGDQAPTEGRHPAVPGISPGRGGTAVPPSLPFRTPVRGSLDDHSSHAVPDLLRAGDALFFRQLRGDLHDALAAGLPPSPVRWTPVTGRPWLRPPLLVPSSPSATTSVVDGGIPPSPARTCRPMATAGVLAGVVVRAVLAGYLRAGDSPAPWPAGWPADRPAGRGRVGASGATAQRPHRPVDSADQTGTAPQRQPERAGPERPPVAVDLVDAGVAVVADGDQIPVGLVP